MSVNKFRNFKMVGYVIYGRGSFDQLDEILAPYRKGDAPIIYLVDHFFEKKALAGRLPLRGKDKAIFVDVTHEPKTSYVDQLAGGLRQEFGSGRNSAPSAGSWASAGDRLWTWRRQSRS
jgi:3-deoxy-alpha-D-manno-octulosonate 8-oxidase